MLLVICVIFIIISFFIWRWASNYHTITNNVIKWTDMTLDNIVDNHKGFQREVDNCREKYAPVFTQTTMQSSVNYFMALFAVIANVTLLIGYLADLPIDQYFIYVLATINAYLGVMIPQIYKGIMKLNAIKVGTDTLKKAAMIDLNTREAMASEEGSQFFAEVLHHNLKGIDIEVSVERLKEIAQTANDINEAHNENKENKH